MNLFDKRYADFAIVKEMLETPAIIKNFNPQNITAIAETAAAKKRIFFTGEGSSRIFPAKRAINYAMTKGGLPPVVTEGSNQALEYPLDDYAVIAASNSGKTKETVHLLKKLKTEKHNALISITAANGTPLMELSHVSHLLSCKKETAVAATKSVMELALVYDIILRTVAGDQPPDLAKLSENIETVLQLPIDPKLTEMAKNASKIYFAGRNNGVAEELVLKTNEITRKKSAYLEGTYAVHGIEEVMDANEMLVVIDPFESEEEKFQSCLEKGVGMKVIAIASRETIFPTFIIPEMPEFNEYIQLSAGWNLLIEIGTAIGVNPDKPVRARKIGNEFIG